MIGALAGIAGVVVALLIAEGVFSSSTPKRPIASSNSTSTSPTTATTTTSPPRTSPRRQASKPSLLLSTLVTQRLQSTGSDQPLLEANSNMFPDPPTGDVFIG